MLLTFDAPQPVHLVLQLLHLLLFGRQPVLILLVRGRLRLHQFVKLDLTFLVLLGEPLHLGL